MPEDRDAAMKFFTDLHLCPHIGRMDQARPLIEKSSELGYDAVGISFDLGVMQREVEELRDACNTFGVDLVTRANLMPRDSSGLLRNLRVLRRKFEVIAVLCSSKAVARQAAKDRRVDLLSFLSTDTRKRFFDSAEAELASKGTASVEIDMAPLLYLQGSQRIRLLSRLRKETQIARKYNVPIVLSSGADSPRLLRKPDEYAFLSYLFGLDFPNAMRGFSENPKSIVERNKKRLNSSYIAPGVYLVRRGKDCPDV